MNRFLLYLMLILGECLIIAGFFLFLQDVQPTNLFALNLVAAMCVFALGYARIFDIGQTAEMRSGYAGMGLRWFAVMLFSVASVVLIVCSIVWSLSFAFCIWLQLVFLFGAGFLLFGAKISGDNATRVLARIEDERGDLKALAAQLTLMEIAAGKSPICAEGKAAVERLRTEMNYLTVSLTPTAKSLELELQARFRAMTDSLKDPAVDAGAFSKAVAECVEIIRMRRNQYYK